MVANENIEIIRHFILTKKKKKLNFDETKVSAFHLLYLKKKLVSFGDHIYISLMFTIRNN